MNGHPPHLIDGLWCATLTPLAESGAIDHARFAAHVQWLLSQGVRGIAPFGTTGEGQSFSVDERRQGLDALLSAIPSRRVLPGTGCASLEDTIALTRHATQAGCIASLVLPPFFWKGPSDEGLYAWYARLIDGVNDPRLRIFLYHLPQVSSVPLSIDLVARLAHDFPGTIAGIKDSQGSWDNTAALLARVPQLAIVIGHEPDLPRLVAAGGAGTICGVANAYPHLVQALLAADASADTRARIAKFVEILFMQPFLPAFKSIVADRTGDARWCDVRPPLVPLSEAQRRVLRETLHRAGFSKDGR
ncbi:MAG: dihydrodipicolinate synthase family protein [Burkholderiales bacterium]